MTPDTFVARSPDLSSQDFATVSKSISLISVVWAERQG